MSGSAWGFITSIEIEVIFKVITVKEVIAKHIAIFFYDNISSISMKCSIPRR